MQCISIILSIFVAHTKCCMARTFNLVGDTRVRGYEFYMKLGSALSNWRKLHGGCDLLGSCNRDCFAVIPQMIVLSLFPDPYFRWGKFVPDLKSASGTVTLGTIENKQMLVSLLLFLVMETVQTGARVAKRIIKKSKFFCVVFKEVVSCFFQALDIFFRLGSTEFLKNKIPWIGHFFRRPMEDPVS